MKPFCIQTQITSRTCFPMLFKKALYRMTGEPSLGLADTLDAAVASR